MHPLVYTVGAGKGPHQISISSDRSRCYPGGADGPPVTEHTPLSQEHLCKRAISSPPVTSAAISSPLRAPRSPASLTWRTGQCHVPEGCSSPPSSSAGSALTLGAPCSLSPRRVSGRSDGTLEAWAPSTHMQRHLLGDAGEPPFRPSALLGWGPETSPLLVQPRRCARPAWPRPLPGDPAWAAALCTPKLPENRPLKLRWLPPTLAQEGLRASSAPALGRYYPRPGKCPGFRV